jgi:hypothetical protein
VEDNLEEGTDKDGKASWKSQLGQA